MTSNDFLSGGGSSGHFVGAEAIYKPAATSYDAIAGKHVEFYPGLDLRTSRVAITLRRPGEVTS
jgi:hypothetical protein